MSTESAARGLDLNKGAEVLRLPPSALEALYAAGYVRALPSDDGVLRFAASELKGLQARLDHNFDASPPPAVLDDFADLDPGALLDDLTQRSGDMARRAVDLLIAAFPEYQEWTEDRREGFERETRHRLEAIIGVAMFAPDVDDSVFDEFAQVGAEVAWTGAPLTELLLVLRISRDLVVQTAVEVAEDRGRHWGLALSVVLTRVLPALDRLVDAVARGYWEAVIHREAEALERFANVVEQASDGVFEINPGGVITYVNNALCVILGRNPGELLGERLTEVLGIPEALLVDGLSEVEIRRGDGVLRRLELRLVERRRGGAITGRDGVVRDLSAAVQAERLRNDLLALLTEELRQPLTVVLGLAATLATYGEEMGADRAVGVGQRIRAQAERMARLVDDLLSLSRLELGSLVLSPRVVELVPVISAALSSTAKAKEFDVRVSPDLRVVADPRRLEQVVANLADNAARFGRPPVVVEALDVDPTTIEVSVTDHGTGVDPHLIPTLFSELRPFRDRARRADGGGIGLALVRGLVEAMGGRVRYEANPKGGARFVVSLPRG